MAVAFDITADHHVFIGTAKDLEFVIYEDETQAAAIDITGWDLLWEMRLTDRSDTVLISKETGSPTEVAIAGTFNADPAQNTQKVTVHILADDTYADWLSPPEVLVKPNIYRYALRRTDDGSEMILTFGEIQILQAAAH